MKKEIKFVKNLQLFVYCDKLKLKYHKLFGSYKIKRLRVKMYSYL